MNEYERKDLTIVKRGSEPPYGVVSRYKEISLVLTNNLGSIKVVRDIDVLEKTVNDLVNAGYGYAFDGEGDIGRKYASEYSSLSHVTKENGVNHREIFDRNVRVIITKNKGRFIFFPNDLFALEVGFIDIDYKYIIKKYMDNYVNMHMKCNQCGKPIGSLNNLMYHNYYTLTNGIYETYRHIDCGKHNTPSSIQCNFKSELYECWNCGRSKLLVKCNDCGKPLGVLNNCEYKDYSMNSKLIYHGFDCKHYTEFINDNFKSDLYVCNDCACNEKVKEDKLKFKANPCLME